MRPEHGPEESGPERAKNMCQIKFEQQREWGDEAKEKYHLIEWAQSRCSYCRFAGRTHLLEDYPPNTVLLLENSASARRAGTNYLPPTLSHHSKMLCGRVITFALVLVLVPASRSLPTLSAEEDQGHVKYDAGGGNGTGVSSNGTRDDDRAVKRACQCTDGLCGCCTGILMQNFVNYTPRQRGCLNITYDPDDFAFAMAVVMNDRVLYKNTISGKNPRPLCVPLPRVQSAKFCVRLSNVYFVGRNLHACIDMEARWQNQQTFQMSFDCIRIGADGVKVLKPEDGAGIAVGVPVNVTPAPDEYDEIPAEQPPEDEEVAEAGDGQTEKPLRNTPSKIYNTTTGTQISKQTVELSTNTPLKSTSAENT